MADEQEDQATQSETAGAGQEPQQTTPTQQTQTGADGKQPTTQTEAKGRDDKGRFAGKTAAAGAETQTEQVKPVWPEDWRERMAAHVGGADEKAVAKELKRLQRLTDPNALYSSYRELDGRFSEGGLIKLPGKDAKPEDVQAFHKAMGVPEKPDDYIGKLKLGDGQVLGDDDKPIFEAIAKPAHAAGVTPAQLSAVTAAFLAQREEQAAKQFQDDETFRGESMKKLSELWGESRKANIAAISTLFAEAPGGSNPDAEGGLMNRVLGGRTSDGRVIGDDPDIVAWLAQMARLVNPAATLIPSGSGPNAKSIDDEIADIETFMHTNRADYFKDDAKQARYRDLIAARDTIRARKAA